MRVCWRCLLAIESKEGSQPHKHIFWDGESDDFICEWCESDLETELYEI